MRLYTKLLLVMSFLLCLCGCSKRVLVKGKVSSEGFSTGFIVFTGEGKSLLRDSLNPDSDNLFKDSRFVATATDDGSFKIKARPNDSLFFCEIGCITQVYKVRDLLKRDSVCIVLAQEPCIEHPPCDKENYKLIAVVVSNISLDNQPDCFEVLDSRYMASCVVKQILLGNFKQNDTLTFEVYDHYGSPAFVKYQNVLIFVGDYCGWLRHVKYQYNNVYLTTDGRWAAPYQMYDYARLEKMGIKTTIVPQLISFKEPVIFDLEGFAPEVISVRYPEPYYKIEGNKAIAVYGNYVEELLELKKLTTLKEFYTD